MTGHILAGHRAFQVPAWVGGPFSAAYAKTPAGSISARKAMEIDGFPLFWIDANMLFRDLCHLYLFMDVPTLGQDPPLNQSF